MAGKVRQQGPEAAAHITPTARTRCTGAGKVQGSLPRGWHRSQLSLCVNQLNEGNTHEHGQKAFFQVSLHCVKLTTNANYHSGSNTQGCFWTPV